jgi:hypothetical protein
MVMSFQRDRKEGLTITKVMNIEMQHQGLAGNERFYKFKGKKVEIGEENTYISIGINKHFISTSLIVFLVFPCNRLQ